MISFSLTILLLTLLHDPVACFQVPSSPHQKNPSSSSSAATTTALINRGHNIFHNSNGQASSSSSSSSSSSNNNKSTTLLKSSQKTHTPPIIIKTKQNSSSSWQKIVKGPPQETRPDYENIHGPLGKFMDTIFLSFFRSKMVDELGFDSSLPQDDYKGLMEVAAALNARYSNREEVQKAAQNVLRSLFPSWMPGRFAIMFSKPFPAFSSKLNAWATKVAGTWLMGECELNDCEIDGDDDGRIGKQQGLLVKRCRFLEESGCASVCVNSCKIPTQKFFSEDMGLPLTMTPDYETGECQFSFGLTPTATGEFDAKNIPCLSRCPSAGSMRTWHSSRDDDDDDDGDGSREGVRFNDDDDGSSEESLGLEDVPTQCGLME